MRYKFFYLITTFALFASSLVFGQGQAQPAQPQSSPGEKQPEYTFRTTTRLVILDLVATDEKGNTVTDLKPEEVQIFENGKEQVKQDFSFIQPGPRPVEKADFHLPPDVYTNARQYTGNSSYNIILFDVLNTSFVNLAYAHDQLIKYLDEAPPNQPTALFALGNKLWLLHDFTTDHQALKDAIKKFKGQGSKLVISSPDGEEAYKRKSTFSTIGADRVWTTLDAFQTLARIMKAYKGRKNLIWLSSSFVVNVMPDYNPRQGLSALGEYDRAVEQMSDAMMEAQIAIYPIDAYGLSGEAFRPMMNRFNAQSSLLEIAAKTGGKAFTNRNDLDMGIRTSIDDGSSYYTTSYHPPDKGWDGKLRKIEVKTTRPGVKLRYRQGYYAVDPSATANSKKEKEKENKQTSLDFAEALDPDLPPSTELIFQARVLPPSEKTSNKVVVNFAVDPRMVTFQRAENGMQHAELSCIAWAFPVKGKPINSGGCTVNAQLDAENYKKIMQAAVPCNQSLDLGPGNYMLRLGVIDHLSRHIGALTAWVTVPDAIEAPAQKTLETR